VPKSQRVSAYLFFFFLVSVAAAALEVGTARSLLSALCSDERPSLSKNHKKKKKNHHAKNRVAPCWSTFSRFLFSPNVPPFCLFVFLFACFWFICRRLFSLVLTCVSRRERHAALRQAAVSGLFF
jgi:hypothetical protein